MAQQCGADLDVLGVVYGNRGRGGIAKEVRAHRGAKRLFGQLDDTLI